MLLFSVVVPAYNIETFLPKCIESVLKQTYDNYELILVDDGSTDSTGKICDESCKKDERIRVIHKENGGLVSARKAGAEKAQGKYVICLDGDDWIEPETLSTVDRILTENGDVDVVCFGHIISSDTDTKMPFAKEQLGLYDKQRLDSQVLPVLIQAPNGSYFRPSVWAKAMKRELYTKYQSEVDNRIKIAEDAAVTVPTVANAGSMYIAEECLYHYRANPASMTKNRKAFAWNGPELLGKQLEGQLPMEEHRFREQLYGKVAHEVFSVAISRCFEKRKYAEKKKDLLEGLSNAYYEENIAKSSFSSLRGKLMKCALRHKSVFVINLFSKIKRF